ncbi:MAG: helix-turn-helix transcriptional regulator [Clostridia bacterium]|nr:helix-turn-helix transcriptional regulator [Clostridia bacterium]
MLNEQIKKLRTACGITQVQLAKSLGVTKQSVSNWENDNIQPSIDMLIRLAEFFQVSTDYMLGLDTKETIDVTELTNEEIAHIRFIISDITSKQKNRSR